MNPEQASHRQAIPMNTLHNPVLLRAPDIVSSVDVAEGFSTVFSPASRFFATRELPVPVNTKETSAITPLSMSHPASVDDDTPSYPVGTRCDARLRIYPWYWREMRLKMVYGDGTDRMPSDLRGIWTDWMPGVIEKEQLSMTVSGAIVKSYIVRAQRPDSKCIKMFVIPYYGELRVPEFRQKDRTPIFRQPELSPDETIRRIVQAGFVWIAISTDYKPEGTLVKRSGYMWYRAALALVDRSQHKMVLATVLGGPYDSTEQRSCLSITIPDDVPLVQGNAENEMMLLRQGASIWGNARTMQRLVDEKVMAVRRPPKTLSVCLNPPAEGGQHTPFTKATFKYLRNRYAQ